jgi:hypothetical protein
MKYRLYLLLVFACFVFSANIYSMDSGAAIDFDSCYKAATKELNLTDVQLGDEGLEKNMEAIKTFVEKNGVQRFLLDNVGLTIVPFELIGFATVNKTLTYISLKKNEFVATSKDDFTSLQPSSQGNMGMLFRYIANLFGKMLSSKTTDFLILDVDFFDEPIMIGKSFGFSNSKLITVPVLIALGAVTVYFAPQLAGVWINNFPSTCDSMTLQALAQACKICASNATGV